MNINQIVDIYQQESKKLNEEQEVKAKNKQEKIKNKLKENANYVNAFFCNNVYKIEEQNKKITYSNKDNLCNLIIYLTDELYLVKEINVNTKYEKITTISYFLHIKLIDKSTKEYKQILITENQNHKNLCNLGGAIYEANQYLENQNKLKKIEKKASLKHDCVLEKYQNDIKNFHKDIEHINKKYRLELENTNIVLPKNIYINGLGK